MYSISTTSLQSIYAPSAKTRSSKAKDDDGQVSFSKYLDSAVEETEEISGVPTDWSTDSNGNWAAFISIKAVKEYMQNELGIDADNRTFTHEITDEQREWLASRHDMDALKTASTGSKEFLNFMGDLYYLGVFSSSDIAQYCSPCEYKEPGLYYVGPDMDYESPDPNTAALEFTVKLIEYEKRLLDHIDDPAKRQRLQDSLNYRQELNGVLQNFFNSF